ncbi:YY1-associated protein 1-like isoform X2 [Papio anubis]|nr:YY1-associated protein 1-like isoform X2 [Papio anubis]XP_031515533.1 YY1-associated protein 1-like isoform X2 [Papio anubis]
MGFSNMEDDGPEEEERVAEPRPNFNTPQALRFEELLANLLNEQHQIAKELLEQLKMKKSSAKQQKEVEKVKPQCKEVHQTLILDPAQRKRLQQQMQQHVQLLTQIHLLATCNPNLNPDPVAPGYVLSSLCPVFPERAGNLCSKLHRPSPSVQPQVSDPVPTL